MRDVNTPPEPASDRSLWVGINGDGNKWLIPLLFAVFFILVIALGLLVRLIP